MVDWFVGVQQIADQPGQGRSGVFRVCVAVGSSRLRDWSDSRVISYQYRRTKGQMPTIQEEVERH